MIINNKQEAIAQLKHDKHTLLEGYVTEYLFNKQFLVSMGDKYSHGWWSGTLSEKRFFFVIKDKLTTLDMEILSLLNTKYDCWQVDYSSEKWAFIKNGESLQLDEFISRYNLTRQQMAVEATVDTTNIDRQEKCISFFGKCGTLTEIAVERNFADNILSVYFKGTLNIDFFTKNRDGKICIIEVKFKSESYDGVFGINVGEVAMFKELREFGFLVVLTILYKNRLNKDMSIFDYLENNEIDHSWYIKDFIEDDLDTPGVAPAKTSVDGKKMQGFYKLNMNKIIQEKYKKPLDVSLI